MPGSALPDSPLSDSPLSDSLASGVEPAGSLLIRQARLVQLTDPAPDHPVDVLVTDGVVTEIAPALDSVAGVDEIDLGGRWVMPGLWDQHVHLGQWVLTSGRLDLAGTPDVESAVRLVRDRFTATDGAPVLAWGHRPATWPQPPTVAALDEVSDTVPIVLIAGDGHHGWLNSAALGLLGLPPRTGVVAEGEWFDNYARLEALGLSGDISPASYQRTMEHLAGLGIVGLVDLEFGERPHSWGERVAAGADLLRIRGGVYPDGLAEFIAAGLSTGSPLPGCSPRQVFGVLKLISDGSLNTGTAWCCAPYPSGAGTGGEINYGAANFTEAQMDALVSRAADHGIEVATHAIGDAAVAQALDVHERWGAAGSIEHAQLIRVEDIDRLARLGLRASVQPAHLLDDRDPSERIWPDRVQRCFMFATMLDAGVDVVLGSDAPVSPLDPWLSIAAAVHRSADERPPWHPEQALTVRQALAASVDRQGTVHVGMPADLIALPDDPLGPAPDSTDPADSALAGPRLRGSRPDLTLIDGRVAHTAL